MSTSERAFPVLISSTQTFDLQKAGSMEASATNPEHTFPKLTATSYYAASNLSKTLVAAKQTEKFQTAVPQKQENNLNISSRLKKSNYLQQESRRREKSADTAERSRAHSPKTAATTPKKGIPARAYLSNQTATERVQFMHPAALPPMLVQTRSASAAPHLGDRERSPAPSDFRGPSPRISAHFDLRGTSPRPSAQDIARREGSVPRATPRPSPSPGPEMTFKSPRAPASARQSPAPAPATPRATPAPAAQDRRAVTAPPAPQGWLNQVSC
jgi:hypothetical protein